MSETQQTDMGMDSEPLFPEEAVSEDELRGVEETPPDAAESTTSDEQPETSADAEQVGPVDFTPLEQEADFFTEPAEDDFSDFKTLSLSEFENLLEEDPDAAAVYQYRQARFKDYSQRLKLAQAMTSHVIEEGMSEIEKIIPDIYSSTESTKASELARFAVDHGMDPTFLEYLTTPNTRIVVPGKKPILMGRGAAALVKMIAALHEKTASAKKIGEHRTTPIKSDNRGLVISEAEMDAMSEEEIEAYLKGE